MKLICPSCGAICSAEGFLNDALARQCLLIVGELPLEVSRRCLNYLALFRTASGRGLPWSKALRLLAELSACVKQGHIQWERNVARPNSAVAWGRALEVVIERPPQRLPLTSHGYLRKIAYGFADEMDKEREKAEIRDQRSEIRSRKNNQQSLRGVGPYGPEAAIDNQQSPGRIDFEDMKGITDKRFRKK